MDYQISRLEKHRLHQQEVRSKYGDYVVALYFCDSDIFRRLKIENWIHNRPPDQGRVTEVASDISLSGRVQGTIALASLSGSLVCYDGNHRRLALTNEVSGSYKILLSVIWAATEDSIIDEYESLNKSISVPLVYMNNKDEGAKEGNQLIARYCKWLAEYYPSFSSPAKACHTPNFNRDVLTDDILALCEDYSDSLTIKQVIDNIKKMNIAYAESRYKFKKGQLSTSVQNKCERDGLWLFCRYRTIDRQYFELVLES